MKVIAYVEGPSDRLSMAELLGDLLARLQARGVAVQFIPTGNKQRLMIQTPAKAANILQNDSDAVVLAVPDLYPPNIGFPHASFDELAEALLAEFDRALRRKGIEDARLRSRFRIFCFKHDLEALVLAASDQLASRLGASTLERTWTLPVEDQDHNKPPKRVVEHLFRKHGQAYRDTVDAPLILGAVRYEDIAAACPQCFKPFVDYLESLLYRV